MRLLDMDSLCSCLVACVRDISRFKGTFAYLKDSNNCGVSRDFGGSLS